MSEIKEIGKASKVLALFTFVSRLLGLVRNQILSHFFGASAVADAFVAAFTIPNALRRLLGEGALTPSLVSTLTRYRQESDSPMDSKDWRSFISSSFAWLTVICLVVVGLGIFFAPDLVRLYVPEFENEKEKFDLTVSLTRWLFPFLLFIAWSAFLMGVLNTFRDFALSAFVPAMISVSVIAIVPLAYFFLQPEANLGIFLFASAILLGALLQVALQWPRVKRYQATPSLNFRWRDPRVKALFFLLVPSVFSLAVYQINIIINRSFASGIPGAVSHLFYADLILELPVAIIATSLGTAILPSFSRLIAKKDLPGLKEALAYALRSVAFLGLPATIGLIALSTPIVSTLYFTGRFQAEDLLLSSGCLVAYALGLPFFSGLRIALGYFFSSLDTKTPFWISLIAIAVNYISALLLSQSLGAAGIALATSISSTFQTLALFLIILHRRPGLFDRTLVKDILKTLLAAAMMGGGLLAVTYVVGPSVWMESGIGLQKIGRLGLLVTSGICFYAVACSLLRIDLATTLMKRVRSKLFFNGATPKND